MDIGRRTRIVMFGALLCPFGQLAASTVLTLPPSNEMSTGTFGDFQVYSLDLLDQCSAAGDPRCLPSGPYPIQSSPGQIADQLVIYTGNNGLSNFDGAPFAPGSQSTVAVDEPFRAPAGTETTFVMSGANEPGAGGGTNTTPEFSGDIIGRWDAYLPSVLSYLTNPVTGVTSDLVFLFDNNQKGSDPGQWQSVWGQVRIFDGSGAMQACYELHFSADAGCLDTGPNPTPDIATDYVPVLGNFCVDVITGASYNIGTAANDGDCAADAGHPSGGYFVNNNLGQDNAEFAAYISELNENLESWAANGWSMSVDMRLANLNDGHEQLWICDQCNLTAGNGDVPEPGLLFVTGLALLLHRWRLRITH